MDWDKHINTLKKFASQFNNDLGNFDKHTQIHDFVRKFSKFSYYKLEQKKLSLNFDSETNFNETCAEDCQKDYQKDYQKESVEMTFNSLLDKKIKKKHLLKKIHPDKINFLINKIKNKFKNVVDLVDLDLEKTIILQCVTKIISEKLNIVDSLNLLYVRSKLFEYICYEIGISKKQINSIKLYFNNLTKSNCVKDDFKDLFSNDIKNFINVYNTFNLVKSSSNQIKIYFIELYRLISEYVQKKIQIINKINDESAELEINLKLKKNDYEFEKNYKLTNLNTIEIKLDYFISSREKFEMFKEENHPSLMIYKKIYKADDFKLLDFIRIYKDIDTNKDFYEYLDELKIKIPIFYDFIMNIKMNTSCLSYGLPYAFELDFLQIVNEEMNRIKFII